ncbi:hypothetical protein B0H17DRAFT_1096717 [Mycena rosella]|uniref:Uncharacterized protein n=1 Tax=Mycena rosella TaxID=1033263 RepID=A0AAD7CQW3_MYCRO|nr:hypothetical protein B0H17DRAFT_1096717 [Mycena rosella]
MNLLPWPIFFRAGPCKFSQVAAHMHPPGQPWKQMVAITDLSLSARPITILSQQV